MAFVSTFQSSKRQFCYAATKCAAKHQNHHCCHHTQQPCHSDSSSHSLVARGAERCAGPHLWRRSRWPADRLIDNYFAMSISTDYTNFCFSRTSRYVPMLLPVTLEACCTLTRLAIPTRILPCPVVTLTSKIGDLKNIFLHKLHVLSHV